jgi:MFS family permease
MTSSPASKKPPFFGWRVVTATFILAIFGWGVGFYGPPIYLQMVVQRTGWSVTLVSTAVTLHFLVGAAVVANLPRLYRLSSVPVVTVTGAAFLAVGVGGWSVADQPWHLFAAALLTGTGWVAMGAAAVNAIISPWFIRSRPAALSMAYNGASVGGVIFSPLWVMLIASSGFSQAAFIVGISMVATVAALAVLVFCKSPETLGQSPDGLQPDQLVSRTAPSLAATLPRGLLWRDRRFITLAVGMAAGLFAQIGLLAHLFSIMVPVFGSQTAGLLMGGANPVGNRRAHQYRLVDADFGRPSFDRFRKLWRPDHRLPDAFGGGWRDHRGYDCRGPAFRPRHWERHVASASHRTGGIQQSRCLARGAADRGFESSSICSCTCAVWHRQDNR